MQAFLVELVNHFKFEMTEESGSIKSMPSFVMVAVVRGKEGEGGPDVVENQVFSSEDS